MKSIYDSYHKKSKINFKESKPKQYIQCAQWTEFVTDFKKSRNLVHKNIRPPRLAVLRCAALNVA